MKNSSVIAIVGGGLMGHGIALNFARAGHLVRVTDPLSEARASLPQRVADSLSILGADASETANVLQNMEVCDAIAGAVSQADYVVEAGPEKLDVKHQIFAEIEVYAPEKAILASNTSVIQITKIMQHLKGKHRAMGTHWWNPPHMIPLVEVIKTQWTDSTAAQAMFDLLEASGKTPVMVKKDVPGFIGNRLQHALWREAMSLVEKGICDAESVDTVVKASFGRRLAVLGPLENADLIGTDLTLDIHENVLFDLESYQGPSPYLNKLVSQGNLGMKTGQGFRIWTDEQAAQTREKVGTHLRKLEEILND